MKRISFLVMVVAAACGGDGPGDSSGVDQAKVVTTLSASEVSDFCSWAIDVQGGEGHVTECGDGVKITAPTQTKCETDYGAVPDTSACMGVTIGDVETCVNAIGSDPCTAIQSSACSKWLSCATSGG
jgi:hypothetical protein